MTMGRPRKHNKKLPISVYFRHNSYFFVDRTGRWHNLGKQYIDAITKYAELNSTNEIPLINLATIIDRYARDVIPEKSPKTQIENTRQIALLRSVFGKMRPDDVLPKHIYQYLDRRPPVAGNREKALLSHVYTYAIRWGVATNNPCKLVVRNQEKPRDRYVTDDEYLNVFNLMPPAIQIAMEFALLTGLRQADILKLQLNNLTADGLLVQTKKTGKRILFEWTDELRDLVERSKKLPCRIASMYLIKTKHGTPYSGSGFRSIWQREMRKSQNRFTFHDLRAKASSDTPDKSLLGHANADTQRRVYQRTPLKVRPIRPRVLDVQNSD
jgi:integrase